MKKRGIFSLVVLLALSTLFAAQTTTNIGTAYELVISDVAFSQAETNNSSSVSIITRKQIEAYNAQSTGELVNKAIGTNVKHYGYVGGLQTLSIRGVSSSKSLIFLDGALLSSAHDGNIDLSMIPVSTIERIEIVKNGSGNFGRTNAIGGMVNIITKKGAPTKKPFTFSVGNGSFLPEAYGSSDTHNWLSLVDSQSLDLTYADTLQGTNLVANIGGIVAQNAYVYDSGTSVKALRDNAQTFSIHGNLNANGLLQENIEFTSNNLANFKHLGVPGSTASLSPNDYMNDVLFSTNNSLYFSNLQTQLTTLKFAVNYKFAQTFYHSSYEYTHNKHKGNFLAEGSWEVGEAFNLITGIDIAADYVDSTFFGSAKTRLTPTFYSNGSMYMLHGDFSLHASANVAYLSDREALSPNASFGAIYNLNQNNALKINISYAENPPTFSDLYGSGVTLNLNTEKGIQGDVGYSTKLAPLTYESTVFGRNIYNAIIWTGTTSENIGHSVYFGTEQAVTLDLNDMFAFSASYLYNKSYDLSDGKTFSDRKEVDYVRKHTAKASASFAYKMFDAVLSCEYLDAYKGIYGDADPAFVLNLSVNAQVTDQLKVYVAVDNLLNASYELVGGYPMPGTKIRIGGTLKF